MRRYPIRFARIQGRMDTSTIQNNSISGYGGRWLGSMSNHFGRAMMSAVATKLAISIKETWQA